MFLGLALMCLPWWDGGARIQFPNAGYTIESLDVAAEESFQSLMMFLPATDGFAPNVNVQVKVFEDSIEAYMEVSRNQVAQMGLAVIREEVRGNRATFEYSGSLNSGKPMHFYAVAVKRRNKVYLATATALQHQWPNSASHLIRCVDSLQLAH